MRSYTSVSSRDQVRPSNFVTKDYRKGPVSKHIYKTKIGDVLEMKVPFTSASESPTCALTLV